VADVYDDDVLYIKLFILYVDHSWFDSCWYSVRVGREMTVVFQHCDSSINQSDSKSLLQRADQPTNKHKMKRAQNLKS